MPAQQFFFPWRPILEAGIIQPGAKIWFTLEGTNTPAPVYSDLTLETPYTNPVVADATGRVPVVYMNSAVSYRVRIYGKTATVGVSTPLEEYDPYLPGAEPDIAGLEAKLATGGWVNLFDYGAAGDGVTDDLAALNLAIADLNSGVISNLDLPPGNFRLQGAPNPITRDGVSIRGHGSRRSVFHPSGNFDVLWFKSTNPTTTRISDIFLADFGINQGDVTAPSAGVALRLTRADRVHVTNLDIRNCYRCILVEGGADQHWDNITATGSDSWSTLAAGSYVFKATNYTGTTEVPSEIFVTNFNWKGTAEGSAVYLEKAIVIECGDGLFFANGHPGFASTALCHINPQNNAALSVLNIEFTQVYFDGNNSGSATGDAFLISGSATPNLIGIHLRGCVIKNFAGNGLTANLSSLIDLAVTDTMFSDIGKYHVSLTNVDDFDLSGNIFRSGNTSNTSADAVKLTGCAAGTVRGNRIMGGAFAHPNGLNIATSSDVTVHGNLFRDHVNDMTADSSSPRLSFIGNRRVGSAPTLGAAGTITIPIGHSLIDVTGTGTINTITAPNIKGYEITLLFASTAAVGDGAGNILLAGAFTATANSTLTLINNGTNWSEKSRAVV